MTLKDQITSELINSLARRAETDEAINNARAMLRALGLQEQYEAEARAAAEAQNEAAEQEANK